MATEVDDDRRATIEAAFDAVEGTSGVQEKIETPTEGVLEGAGTSAPAEGAGDAKPAVGKPAAEDTAGTDEGAPQVPVDKAPQSWRAAQKAQWDKLPPDVRQEVMRREREITKTLGDTSQARQVAQAFQQTVQPYMARIQSLGTQPMAAIGELLKADHILTTAPKAQRAAFMAKLIADYDIDVHELDRVLSGQAPADPVQSTVDKLLQERLAPFMKFIQNQTESQQANDQAATARMQNDIETMSSDPKFPEFDNVREDMADIIDIQAKKGVYLTLEQAYTRAIAMNPEVNARVQAQTQQAQKLNAAKMAHARAQRASNASSSVSGAPTGNISGTAQGNDRRATIAAAFDQIEGR